MSMSDTLEKGAHHQTLDLSEELPPHHHHHHTNHHHHLHHSNSLASTTAVGGGRETPSRVVVPPPYSAAESGGGGSEAPLELRGSLDCWACSVLVTAQNLLIAAINACLAGLVFGTILTPAIVMVVFGFLCHSTVSKGKTGEKVDEGVWAVYACQRFLIFNFSGDALFLQDSASDSPVDLAIRKYWKALI